MSRQAESKMDLSCWAKWALRVFSGSAFVASGLLKIISLGEFASTLASYELPRGILNMYAAGVVCAVEILAGSLVVLNKKVRLSAAVLILMLIGFTSLALWNRSQGRTGECGCFGTAIPRQNDNWLLLENGVLTLMLLPSVLQKRVAASRSAGAHGDQPGNKSTTAPIGTT